MCTMPVPSVVVTKSAPTTKWARFSGVMKANGASYARPSNSAPGSSRSTTACLPSTLSTRSRARMKRSPRLSTRAYTTSGRTAVATLLISVHGVVVHTASETGTPGGAPSL